MFYTLHTLFHNYSKKKKKGGGREKKTGNEIKTIYTNKHTKQIWCDGKF